MLLGLFTEASAAPKLEVGATAPRFQLPDQEGRTFDLAERRGKGWTVLYFYPKAGTPGCTKQACAFRDAISAIRARQAEVYGISADSVSEQKAFHEKHHLAFDLLADEGGKVIEQYGAKMPLLKMAKRWTFLLDPELKIRWVERDVDPLLDAQRVAGKLAELQGK